MTATVIAFPADRRTGYVRQVAQRLHNCRTTREADWHWCRTVDSMVRQMEKAGFEPSYIKAERAAFRQAVAAELQRLSGEAHNKPDHGGDAA